MTDGTGIAGLARSCRNIRRERTRRKWLTRAKMAANVLPVLGVLAAFVAVFIGIWFD